MFSKTDIREKYLKNRLNMNEGLKIGLSKIICSKISKSYFFEGSKTIALYYPFRSEVDVLPLMEAEGKVFAFPRVAEGKLEFAKVKNLNQLSKGHFGIPEPVDVEAINIEDFDLMIVPGIVFDKNGYRLGYGKGFYDRLLSEHPDIKTMGVCYDEFLLESLKMDPWDARVDYIATQSGVLITEKEVAGCH